MRTSEPSPGASPDVPLPLPLAHRLARRLATQGLRGARAYWFVADLIASTPAAPLLEVEKSVALAIDRTDWLADAIYRGLYERAETQIVRAVVPRGGTVVDVGANLGYYTMLAASLVGDDGRVVAFEPSPRCLPALARAAAKAPSVVEVRPVAVGAENGVAALVDDERAHSGLASLRAGKPGDPLAVRVCRLDDALELDHIDLLKIDVEGFEQAVLLGAQRTLGTGRVAAIMCEVSPEFGPVGFAADLIEALARTHQSFLIDEVGTLRRGAALFHVDRREVERREAQFNLLLVQREISFLVHRFTRTSPRRDLG